MYTGGSCPFSPACAVIGWHVSSFAWSSKRLFEVPALGQSGYDQELTMWLLCRCLRSGSRLSPVCWTPSVSYRAATSLAGSTEPDKNISFSDGQAFRLKSRWEVIRGLLIFRMCSVPVLVRHSEKLMSVSRSIMGHRLFEFAMKGSVYGQFVAGENLPEIQRCVNRLKELKIRPMLAVPIEEDLGEGKSGEQWYEQNEDTMMKCVDLSAAEGERPMMQLKITALMSADLCKLLSHCLSDPALRTELTPEKIVSIMEGKESAFYFLSEQQNQHLQNSVRRLSRVGKHAKSCRVRVLVDAEYTCMNPALSLVTMAMMAQCNQSDPWIWNTYQCYLKDSFSQLSKDLEKAQLLGLCFGVKLVRGAYMDKERKLAKQNCYSDPIQPDWESTNRSYQRSMDKMLDLIAQDNRRYNLIIASHNEESVLHAIRRIAELGIDKDNGSVCFGQLLGMCDHVSLTLGHAGYLVYKSIPYGSVESVLPYLIRRAQENQSVLQGIRKERDLLRRELKRRLLGRS
ncbi:hydroxyproline dehydrogenase [Bombina bombina]|uniref:hydroxyproline dehydrogenase n=1 Tax=Bombina bombina TaxID=8345 RepID=UPI00235AD87B|nr:hydroxyproline dehydrogenase [Bombina bombina]